MVKEKGIGEISKLENAPSFIKEKVEELFNLVIYCEGTCKVREVYGMGFGNVKEVETCKLGEQEVKYEVKGREGLRLINYLRETGRI